MNTRCYQKLWLIAAVLGLVCSSWADDTYFYVSTSGSDETGDGSSGDPYRTIAKAFEESSFYGTIEVATGTYGDTAKVALGHKAVTLTSSDPNDPNIVADTIITRCGSDSNSPAINMVNSSAKVRGFTITDGLGVTLGGIGNSRAGGGIYGGNSDAELTNCHITGNLSSAYGSALYNFDGLIKDCIIDKNVVKTTGTLLNCDGDIINCVIKNNICLCSQQSGQIIGGGGSAIAGQGENGSIVNCLITGNWSRLRAGALLDIECDTIHCTIAGNSAYQGAGGAHSNAGDIINCIFQNNSPYGVYSSTFAYCTGTSIEYSCLDDTDGVTPGTGCITSDPCFVYPFKSVDAGYPGCNHGDYGTDEYFIDVFYEGMYSVNDIIEYNDDGVPRIITALGSGTLNRIYFKPRLTAANPYTYYKIIYNWGQAPDPCDFDDFNVDEDWHLSASSLCINAGDPCFVYTDQVDMDGQPRVIDGRTDMGADESYDPNNLTVHNVTQDLWYSSIQNAINYAATNDVIEANEGTYVECIDFLGKAITVRSTDPCDWDVVDATIIDGDENGAVVTFDSSEGSGSILEGFTITNGYNDGDGGGIYCDGASPTIRRCVITGNNLDEDSGGIYLIDGSDAEISHCIIYDNEAENGGAIHADDSDAVITNCLLYENGSYMGGGIYCNDCSDVTITNCTLMNNSGLTGSETLFLNQSTVTATNCIFWKSSYGSAGLLKFSTTLTITYSDVKGGYTGTGNIDSNPSFVDAGNDDYHLDYDSPCIDAGYNSAVDWDYDLDGDNRIINGGTSTTVDMGSDEYDS